MSTGFTILDECANAVFILGAGFSASSGLPVMRDFMPRARDRYFELNRRVTELSHGDTAHNLDADEQKRLSEQYRRLVQHYKPTCEFQIECRGASWILNRDWNDIEELYTQAELRKIITGDEQAKRLCADIQWTIWDIYRRHSQTRILNFGDVLKQARDRQLKPVVITTNYDVLAEVGCNSTLKGSTSKDAAFQFFYPGFERPQMNKRDGILQLDNQNPIGDIHAPNEVPVIKLHGSVNWLYGDRAQHIVASTDLSAKGSARHTICGEWFDPKHFADGHRQQLGRGNAKPLIIPPMLSKTVVYPIIAVQWRAAIEAMRRARQIIVIGYSFPQTDAFMVRLLADGLRDNDGLQDFWIADIQDSKQWAGRIRSLFPETARERNVRYLQISARQLISRYGRNEPTFEGGERIL